MTKHVLIEVFEKFDEFKAMRCFWNGMLDDMQEANPFLRHEWIEAWWTAYGQGKRLFILRFEKEGQVIGYIPFMRVQKKIMGMPFEAISFISHKWTKSDFIIKSHHRECVKALVDFLKKENKVIVVNHMDKSSPNYRWFKEGLQEKKMETIEKTKLNSCLLKDKHWGEIHNLNRKSEEIDEEFEGLIKGLYDLGKVEFERIQKPLSQALKVLEDISQKSGGVRSKRELILSDEGKVFYNEIMRMFGDQGRIEVSLLKLNGVAISYTVGIKSKDHYYAFDKSFNKAFTKVDPDLVLHRHLARTLLNEGTANFEYRYILDKKTEFMDRSYQTSDLSVYPSKLLSRFSSAMK